MNDNSFAKGKIVGEYLTVQSVKVEQKNIDWQAQIERILRTAPKDAAGVMQTLINVGCMIPQIQSSMRLILVHRLLDLCETIDMPMGRASLHFLDNVLVESLAPDERIQIAQRLSKKIADELLFTRETYLWGLVRIIPHLHPIHQKEYAQAIFTLSEDSMMRHHALDALCALIFSLAREPRMGMVLFFVDELSRDSKFLSKYFALELLKKTASALPENELVMVADKIAVLIFHTDPDVVRKTCDYFASIMSFIPLAQRASYAQMMATLVSDENLREDVFMALERIVPLIPQSEARLQFCDLLKNDESCVSGVYFDSSEGLFEPLYSTYKH